MKRDFGFLFLVVALLVTLLNCEIAYGENATNFTGALDTAVIDCVYGTTVRYGTKLYDYSTYAGVSVAVLVKDTAVDGFKEDSSGVRWGVQPAMLGYVDGSLDTLFGSLIMADTVDTGSDMSIYGVSVLKLTFDGDIVTEGNASYGYSYCDTSLTDYKLQVRDLPDDKPWQYFRFWMQGIEGNKTSAAGGCIKNRIIVGKRLEDYIIQCGDNCF